jgi:hypothetical protein
MKNPFHFLYYTGLLILLSFGLIIGLFVINLQNLSVIFVGGESNPIPYIKDTNEFVLDNITPKKTTTEKVFAIETPKLKKEVIKITEQAKPDTIRTGNDSITINMVPRDSSQ